MCVTVWRGNAYKPKTDAVSFLFINPLGKGTVCAIHPFFERVDIFCCYKQVCRLLLRHKV